MKTVKIIEKAIIQSAKTLQFDELDAEKQKIIKSLEKILGKKHKDLWDYKGTIATFPYTHHSYRFTIQTIKAISKLPIKWMEVNSIRSQSVVVYF